MKRLALALGLAVMAALPLQAQAPPTSPALPDLQSVLQRIHSDHVDAFVVSEGFGKSRLTPMMRLRWNPYPIDDGELRVRDVQLLGIAKHAPPVVYTSIFQGFEHGENGPELAGFHTREINADETRALLALARGEKVVSSPEPGGVRLFGPIRARSECLGCHRNKQAGDLLGVFSYRLEPTRLQQQ